MTQTTENNGRYGDAAFGHDRNEERDRLDAFTRTLDAITFPLLDALPIQRDWRCLEIGAGTGSVAIELADRASEGRVIALDRSTAFLDPHARENLEVLEADITTAEFAPGSFDFIHARALLMHVPERDEVLAKLASWLSPGGWILLSEVVDHTSATSPNALHRNLMAGLRDALLHAMGSDMNCARDYPPVLTAHGIVDIAMEMRQPPLRGGAVAANVVRLSCGQLREFIIKLGHLDADGFDAAIAQLSDPDFLDLAPGLHSVWGRRA